MFNSLFSLQMLLESAEGKTEGRKYTVLDLFRTPNLRKIAIKSGVVW